MSFDISEGFVVSAGALQGLGTGEAGGGMARVELDGAGVMRDRLLGAKLKLAHGAEAGVGLSVG